MAKTYMIGNWKMNQSLEEVKNFFNSFKDQDLPEGNFWIAPQLIHINKSIEISGNIKIGSQNVSHENNGAFTGETSAVNLKELGVHFSLVGHSERRALYGETDQSVNLKSKKLLEVGLVPVVCVGETLEERESGKTLDIVLSQIKNGLQDIKLTSESELILAYEPVWAIGTGKTASPEQAEEVHAAIRNLLKELYPQIGQKMSILYGGSVKPANVASLLEMPNINGGLVGGASIKADSFADLCRA
jgi:triosephosphate isomerase